MKNLRSIFSDIVWRTIEKLFVKSLHMYSIFETYYFYQNMLFFSKGETCVHFKFQLKNTTQLYV